MPLSHATPQLTVVSLAGLGFILRTRTPRRARPYRVRSLRTGLSPPVALHVASRQRGYSRLQAGERMPEGDLHPSNSVRFQAHVRKGSAFPPSRAAEPQ